MTTVSPLVAVQSTLETMADKFKQALPPHIDVNKFISAGKLALYSNPKLIDLDRNSLWQTFMKAAQDGLLLDGVEAAAVPYKNQVNYLPMVGGVIKVMHNSKLIKTICAEVVYENDFFDYELGSNPHITHKPLITGDRGKPICVYAIAITSNDGQYIEIMNMDEIEKCRAVARGSTSPHSPWVQWPDQMRKKTVIHRIAKRLPKNDAINSVVRIDDETSFKEPVNVTPNPDKQDNPLAKLKEVMGMNEAEVEQAKQEIENFKKGE